MRKSCSFLPNDSMALVDDKADERQLGLLKFEKGKGYDFGLVVAVNSKHEEVPTSNVRDQSHTVG